MEVRDRTVLERILKTTHFYEERQLECQENLVDKDKLHEDNLIKS